MAADTHADTDRHTYSDRHTHTDIHTQTDRYTHTDIHMVTPHVDVSQIDASVYHTSQIDVSQIDANCIWVASLMSLKCLIDGQL